MTSADAFEAACRHRSWTIERIRDTATFRRLVIHAERAQLLAEMLATLDRYSDDELSELGAEPAALRAFTRQWRDHLTRREPWVARCSHKCSHSARSAAHDTGSSRTRLRAIIDIAAFCGCAWAPRPYGSEGWGFESLRAR